MEENYEPPIKTPAAIPANLQKEIKSDYIYYYMKETKAPTGYRIPKTSDDADIEY